MNALQINMLSSEFDFGIRKHDTISDDNFSQRMIFISDRMFQTDKGENKQTHHLIKELNQGMLQYQVKGTYTKKGEHEDVQDSGKRMPSFMMNEGTDVIDAVAFISPNDGTVIASRNLMGRKDSVWANVRDFLCSE